MSQVASSPAASLTAVRGLIAEIMGMSPDKIVGSAALVADLGATSLDSAEIVMAIEDEFAIEISDDRALSVVTVDDLDALVLQLTKQAPVAA